MTLSWPELTPSHISQDKLKHAAYTLEQERSRQWLCSDSLQILSPAWNRDLSKTVSRFPRSNREPMLLSRLPVSPDFVSEIGKRQAPTAASTTDAPSSGVPAAPTLRNIKSKVTIITASWVR